VRVGGKFALGRKVGSGSFGDIYMGANVETGEEVAIKLESAKNIRPQLQFESKVYKLLQGGVGIPKVHWYGVEGEYNVMVIDLLGPSLEDLLSFCNRRLSLKTVLMLADQMLCRLEWVHSKGIIHRDMKPDNFVIGLGLKANHVHIIDFGLAKRFSDMQTGEHIPYRSDKNLTGTARYASVNTHLGIEQSRRDDLESVGHVLVYLLSGWLPWQGLQANTKKEKYDKVMQKKADTSPRRLCAGYPDEFVTFLRYCKGLQFEEKPDYKYLRRLFRGVFDSKGFVLDFVFDWAVLGSNVVQAVRNNERQLANRGRVVEDDDEADDDAAAA